jgi:hypothetical protein
MFRALVLAALLSAASAASAGTGKWQVTEETAPLDGTRSLSVVLPSDNDLPNLIGAPDKVLVGLTCSPNKITTSVHWPDHSPEIGGSPWTTVYWKLDDGPIQQGRWFGVVGAVAPMGADGGRWFASLRTAHKLVIRADGNHGQQDAVFDLDGVEEVVGRVVGTCFPGMKLKPLP